MDLGNYYNQLKKLFGDKNLTKEKVEENVKSLIQLIEYEKVLGGMAWDFLNEVLPVSKILDLLEELRKN